MHTLHDLQADDFSYRSTGRDVSREDVMPATNTRDRVGVVMRSGVDGLGAVNFILSSVIDFYGTLSEQKEDFFEYPDFYTFQTTDPADYRMFDIYPSHKNVSVDADPELILQAVNDRAITTLLVPNHSSGSPEIDEVTRRSAERTIDNAFSYGAPPQSDGEGFEISLPQEPVAEWWATTVESSSCTRVDDVSMAIDGQSERITQHYRCIPLDEALNSFPTVCAG